MPDARYGSHSLWEVVATALLYRETGRRKIRRLQHISVGELTAYVLEK